MSIETLLALLPTALMIVVAAGLLWAIAALLPLLLARYTPTTESGTLRPLQALIFVGGVSAVGQLLSREAATMVAAILAMLWCGTVARDIYRFVMNRTAVASGGGSRINPTLPTPPRAVAERAATTSASATQLLPYKRFTVDQIAPKQSTVQNANFAVDSISLAKWLDLSPLPTQRLTRRAGLGKQTFTSFRFPKNSS